MSGSSGVTEELLAVPADGVALPNADRSRCLLFAFAGVVVTADSAVPPTTDSERLPTRDAKASSDARRLARLFHETYNRLAPRFAVEDPAMPWDYLPGRKRALMVTVAHDVIREFVAAEVAAARADERERCAQAVEALIAPDVGSGRGYGPANTYYRNAVAVVRGGAVRD